MTDKFQPSTSDGSSRASRQERRQAALSLIDRADQLIVRIRSTVGEIAVALTEDDTEGDG